MSTAAAQGIEGPLVVSRNKVMDMLGIKDSRGINLLVKEGKLNAARIGGRYWKINVASIVAYANGETMGGHEMVAPHTRVGHALAEGGKRPPRTWARTVISRRSTARGW